MWSVRSALLFGVFALTFAAAAVPAKAKIIQYEINGQVYSYNSQSRAQIEAARLRINAANRADELREQARAERESNFFVRLFSSATQTAAAQAETELQRILAMPATTEVRQRMIYAPEPAVIDSPQKTVKVVKGKRTQVVTSDGKTRRVAVARIISTPTHITVEPVRSSTNSDVKSVTIDVNSGTQTTTMRNGSVRQQAVNRNLYEEDPGLSSFVDQIRGRSDPIQSRMRW
jgi:formate-dependent nitrite reductase cytochrome c552 subunit